MKCCGELLYFVKEVVLKGNIVSIKMLQLYDTKRGYLDRKFEVCFKLIETRYIIYMSISVTSCEARV